MRRWFTLCLVVGLAGLAPAQDGAPTRGEFGDGQAVQRFERPRTYDVEHYRIAVQIDPRSEQITGDVTVRLRPLHPNFATAVLDFGALRVTNVTVDDRKATYTHADEQLRVTLPAAAGPDRAVAVRVRYQGRPSAGLYFVKPDAGHPRKPIQVWSQGEPELAHHWFPCWDKPNDFATVEALYTVPAGFTAVGNGALVETKKSGQTWTWHWRQEVPQVAYLVTCVAGRYHRAEERAGDVLLEHYVPEDWPDRDGAIQRSFGKTKAMVGFMEEFFGVPYPYARYAQVCVVDFLWGGMENASATTLTAETLHDARAHLDFKSDGLVIHELAHQWFGDLVTCRDWPHIWLNEGFATYSEALWTRHEKGDAAYRAQCRADLGWYLWEDETQYRRPLVCDRYADADNLFDGHTYSKGARVLYMLHEIMGEAAFREACRAYLEQHRTQPVVTADLQVACEAAAGRPLGWFFDQWCRQPGLPELTVAWTYDAGLAAVVLTVTQTQDTSDGTPYFTLPCTVEVHDYEQSVAHELVIQGRESRFVLPARHWPNHVRFDKHDVICKRLTYERPASQLVSQLRVSGDDVCARIEACEALGTEEVTQQPADRELAVAALREALGADAFHGVRAAAASALGGYGHEGRQPLMDALGDPHQRVRSAAATALSRVAYASDTTIISRLAALVREDQSYRVQADALATLARLGASGAAEQCRWALTQDSHREVVRVAALRGLFTLETPDALERSINATVYGQPTRLVTGAIALLAEHAAEHPAVLARVRELSQDPYIWTRNAAMDALGNLGSPEDLGLLRVRQAGESDGRLRDTARKAILAIEARDRAATEDPGQAQVRALEAKARVAELRAELERVEAELAAAAAEKLRLAADLAAAEAEARKHPVEAPK